MDPYEVVTEQLLQHDKRLVLTLDAYACASAAIDDGGDKEAEDRMDDDGDDGDSIRDGRVAEQGNNNMDDSPIHQRPPCMKLHS